MEVSQNEVPETEVKGPTEKERKLAIEKADIETRNRMAEEQSRCSAFIPELDALCKKFNVVLVADVRMIGVGRNVEQTLNIGARALPNIPVEQSVEVVAKEETPITE